MPKEPTTLDALAPPEAVEEEIWHEHGHDLAGNRLARAVDVARGLQELDVLSVAIEPIAASRAACAAFRASSPN